MPFSLNDIRILAISSNGRWLATGDWQQRDGVKLWNLTTGQAVRSFVGFSAGFSAGGDRLRVAGLDGTTRFWDTESGSLIASLVFIEDSNDWVIGANDGRVDGSDAGLRKLVSWRVGDTVYPADRFLENYRTPGLLEQVVEGR